MHDARPQLMVWKTGLQYLEVVPSGQDILLSGVRPGESARLQLLHRAAFSGIPKAELALD